MARPKNGAMTAEKAAKAKARREANERKAADSGLEAELAKVVQAAPPPTPEPPPAKRCYSRAETRQQIRDCEELAVEGADAKTIWRVMTETPRHLGITQARVRTLLARVRADWSSIATDAERLADRTAAIRRIHRMRQKASLGAAPNYSAVLGFERALMALQGTCEPIQVEVSTRFSTAMLDVIGSLTGEMASEYLEESLEQRRLADLARRELPALVVEARAALASDPASASHDAEE